MRTRVVVLVLGFVGALSGAGYAQDYSKYTQMETPSAYVYFDLDGLAVRIEKSWSCRNADWASTAEPLVLDKAGFDKFKSDHEGWGDWTRWACMVQAGPVTFSRDILKAQRAMNAAPNKPHGAPSIPETGRYNWEMLEYDRYALAAEVSSARSSYKAELAFRLAALLGEAVTEERLLHETDSVLKELIPKAQGRHFSRPDTACGGDATSYYDVAVCKMSQRDELLKEAEARLQWLGKRIEGLRETVSVGPSDVYGIVAEAKAVRDLLRQAEGEEHGP